MDDDELDRCFWDMIEAEQECFDHIDAAAWKLCIEWIRALPRIDRAEEDDVEPLV